MNWRKLIYFPTKKQKEILIKEIDDVLIKCDEIAQQELKEQKENQKSIDGVCPKCRARSENIVNKITDVNGKGNVNGTLRFGFGSVDGSVNIETSEVNHCNKCGNEWKKFKTKFVSKTDILRVILNYLGDIYEDPVKNKNFKWKHEAIQIFDDCHAEAIKILVDKYSHNLHQKTVDVLKLHRLRKDYFSVFDDKN